jgi:hypothetical protein
MIDYVVIQDFRDTVLIGLSWAAETTIVGGHKLFFHVSEKVKTVHISVVVTNFVSDIKRPLILTHHSVCTAEQVEGTCSCLFNESDRMEAT